MCFFMDDQKMTHPSVVAMCVFSADYCFYDSDNTDPCEAFLYPPSTARRIWKTPRASWRRYSRCVLMLGPSSCAKDNNNDQTRMRSSSVESSSFISPPWTSTGRRAIPMNSKKDGSKIDSIPTNVDRVRTRVPGRRVLGICWYSFWNCMKNEESINPRTHGTWRIWKIDFGPTTKKLCGELGQKLLNSTSKRSARNK
jgi:hypothetical protein